MKSYRGVRWLSLFALFSVVLAAPSAFAADHRDAPLLIAGVGDVVVTEKRDVNDIYMFQSPENANNVVFIVTVNPFIGMFAEDGTLDPRCVYNVKIDTNNDFREDIVYSYYFSTPNGMDQQNFILQRGRSVVARGRTGVTTNVTGGGKVLISIQDDPFFFDSGVVPGMPMPDPTPGVDAFGNANITALTLEIPRNRIPATVVNVWTSTDVNGQQVDRTAIPGLNTVLVPDGRNGLADRRNEFNLGQPINDTANFTQGFVDVIEEDFGRDTATALGIADALLPDVLRFDTSSAQPILNGFFNGRRLELDVIDVELQVLTGNNMATDGVDMNDMPFSNTFPYLGTPHIIP